MSLYKDFSFHDERLPSISEIGVFEGDVVCLSAGGVIYNLSEKEGDFIKPKVLAELRTSSIFPSCIYGGVVSTNNVVFSISTKDYFNLPFSTDVSGYVWGHSGNYFFVHSRSENSKSHIYRLKGAGLAYVETVGFKLIVVNGVLLAVSEDGILRFADYDGELLVGRESPVRNLYSIASLEGLNKKCILSRDGRLFLMGEGCEPVIVEILGFDDDRHIDGVVFISDDELVVSYFNKNNRKRGVAKIGCNGIVCWMMESGHSMYTFSDICFSGGFLFTNYESSIVAINVGSKDILWMSRFKNSYISKISDMGGGRVIGYSRAVGMSAMLVEKAI
ncbi:hypothetical protein [Alcanivorax sp. S71-1-4]|uniref:hypothetical protein n=1 Tax=Alcanivorax sp. S71-1-4 TaxID=1177159 RepID=UPI00135B52FC|nr:hypothetical protein [Alcanivorax sp. S71-1-4]